MERSKINKRLNSRVSCMSRRVKFCETRLRRRLTGAMERTRIQRLEGCCRGAVRSKPGRALSPWKHLPYSVDQLREHLEAQFEDGMSWEEMELWHIDHIKPICTFEFTSFDDPEFQACFSLSNLQPRWASQNSKKGGRWFDPKINPTLFEL